MAINCFWCGTFICDETPSITKGICKKCAKMRKYGRFSVDAEPEQSIQVKNTFFVNNVLWCTLSTPAYKSLTTNLKSDLQHKKLAEGVAIPIDHRVKVIWLSKIFEKKSKKTLDKQN